MQDLDHDAWSSLPSTASGRLVPPTTESGRLPRWDQRAGWAPGPYVTEFDDATFDRGVLQSRLPVIVDFWAENCIPCARQASVLEQAGRALLGRVRVGRLNVYENPETTKRYGIKGVPHLMVVRDGQVVLELLGDHSLEQLRRHLGDVGIA
ncbi:MAG: thioredoxin family protein [Planctomycetota bacterium]